MTVIGKVLEKFKKVDEGLSIPSVKNYSIDDAINMAKSSYNWKMDSINKARDGINELLKNSSIGDKIEKYSIFSTGNIYAVGFKIKDFNPRDYSSKTSDELIEASKIFDISLSKSSSYPKECDVFLRVR